MDYNRNLMGGKRPRRGTGTHPEYLKMNLTQRLIAETKALEAYHQRVKQGRFSPKK
jgi:hypothetical protein